MPPKGWTLSPFQGGPFSRCDRASKGEAYYLYYFGVAQPGRFEFDLPEGKRYALDIIDPWNMTITPVAGTHSGKFWLDLPGKPYQAVQVRQVG